MSALLQDPAMADIARNIGAGFPDIHARAPVYAKAVTDTAERIGKEQVCADTGLFSAWLDQQGPDREPSSFGPISTPALVSEILLNESATDDQLARAAREIRTRYLADNAAEVQRIAVEAMQA